MGGPAAVQKIERKNMTSLPPLIALAYKMQEPALWLIKDDLRLAALMLVFTTIDQMALVSLLGDEDVRGNDFIAWVSTYMLVVTGRDLKQSQPEASGEQGVAHFTLRRQSQAA
jgi:hypothetical protein